MARIKSMTASPSEMVSTRRARVAWLVVFVLAFVWLMWHFVIVPNHIGWRLLVEAAALQLVGGALILYGFSWAGDAAHLIRQGPDDRRNREFGLLVIFGLVVLIGLWLAVPTLIQGHWQWYLRLTGTFFGLDRGSNTAFMVSGWITLVCWALIWHEVGTASLLRGSRLGRRPTADRESVHV